MTGNPFAQMSSNPPPTQSTTSGQIDIQHTGIGSSLFGGGSATSQPNGTSNVINSQPTGYGSSLFGSNNYSNFSSQPTGFGSSLFSSSTSNGTSSAPISSQPTGLGGPSLKPFQPTSAFGTTSFGNPSITSQPPPSSSSQTKDSNAFSGSLF